MILTKKTLNKIKQEVNKRKLIIYGNSSVGKTTFASKNDKITFIKTEDNKNEN